MIATKRRGPRYADAATELLTTDEVHDRFDNEWVLLKIAATNERDQVTHGYVLAHSQSRKQISKVVLHTRDNDPGARLFTFVGGTRRLSREEWGRRLDELASPLTPPGVVERARQSGRQ